MSIKTVGSVCSGIEAASVAWEPLNLEFQWFSEIADFPSKVLSKKHPGIRNLGDMNIIPNLLSSKSIIAPDLICGGTPCQAFSLAGWKNGLNDVRGNLTLKFVDIINANDEVRASDRLKPSIVFWENVEGVLYDKTNAFGCFISSLAGLDEAIDVDKWPSAGTVRGPKRNIAWRVLDAKYFGLPQQRRRLYLLAGGNDFFPENVLFEKSKGNLPAYPKAPLKFLKDGHEFEVFREYTDCLYSAYGTKWNGNAAAYNGSLFVVQDNRIRRLSPIECERLMGFPDEYTNISNAKKTNRYQAIGNSWAVPVIKWIGSRLLSYENDSSNLSSQASLLDGSMNRLLGESCYLDLDKNLVGFGEGSYLNCTPIPEECKFTDMRSILCAEAPEDIYISPVGCYGIVRRKRERKLTINSRLEEVLLSIASQNSIEDIEKRSRVQRRGKFSERVEEETIIVNDSCCEASASVPLTQLSMFSKELID